MSSTIPLQSSSTPLQTSVCGVISPEQLIPQRPSEPHTCMPGLQGPTPEVPGVPADSKFASAQPCNRARRRRRYPLRRLFQQPCLPPRRPLPAIPPPAPSGNAAPRPPTTSGPTVRSCQSRCLPRHPLRRRLPPRFLRRRWRRQRLRPEKSALSRFRRPPARQPEPTRRTVERAASHPESSLPISSPEGYTSNARTEAFWVGQSEERVTCPHPRQRCPSW